MGVGFRGSRQCNRNLRTRRDGITMNTKEEVHQELREILEPYMFGGEFPPNLKKVIEQALWPIECSVTPLPPRARTLELYYRFPTDEINTFRRVEVLLIPDEIE